MTRALTPLALALACAALWPAAASAQRRFAVDARVLTGLSIGGGDGQARLRRSPLRIEVGANTWQEEDAAVVVGGSLRLEVEDRASVGVVGRAGLRVQMDALHLLPYIGLAAVLSPRTLVGPEAGAIAAIQLGSGLAILVQIAVDAFPFGDDLPQGTALVQLDGGVGVELVL